jgi:hypothetical protein
MDLSGLSIDVTLKEKKRKTCSPHSTSLRHRSQITDRPVNSAGHSRILKSRTCHATTIGCSFFLSSVNQIFMMIIKSFFDKWGKLKKDCQIDSLSHTAYSRSNFCKGLAKKVYKAV